MKTISCPRCKKTTVYDESNKFRPFCSQRCRIIDLGNWADENYNIPEELQDQETHQKTVPEPESKDEE